MKTLLIRTIIIFNLIIINYPCLYAQQGDTLFIRRSENGSIKFARFKIDVNSDRKMSNDTLFLKSVLKAQNEDEFRLISTKTDKLGIIMSPKFRTAS